VGSRPRGRLGDFFLPYSFERKIIYLLNNLKGVSFLFLFKAQVNLEDREKWQFSRIAAIER